tara:strand:- start:54 stop:350 length:297 start_codon:yes stop_codon:yes gene_type:complete
MSENLTTIIITSISVIFGAGGWKFYEFLIRNKREKEKDVSTEQTMFRDDLKIRVAKLEEDKEECMRSVLEISKSLSALQIKVEYLEKENNELKIQLRK